MEDCLGVPVDQQTTIATATEFICKYISFENGRKIIYKHKLHPDSFPKSTKAAGDFHCAKYMLPIEIKFVCDGERKAVIDKNLSRILTFISKKYSKREFAVDAYLILMETYSFILGMRAQLLRHFGVTKATPDEEGPCWPCDVCGDDCYAEYCGSNVCGKCRHFFISMMRSRRTVATLKCSYYKGDGAVGHKVEERELCTNDFGQIEVACDACRFWKCYKLGMVDEYYDTETQHPSSASCEVCLSKGSLDIDFVLGTYVCGDCLESFKIGMVGKAYTRYECVCLAMPRREEGKCGKCFFDRLRELGFLGLYHLKAQDVFRGTRDPNYSLNLDIIFRNPEQCCACTNGAVDGGGDGLFLGAKVCQVCRSFLELSLREEIYASYCCAEGEVGRLCSLDANSDERCTFCWLRRLEIEGLVDRWFMCKGNPGAWNEAEMESEEREEDRAQGDQVQAVDNGRDNVEGEAPDGEDMKVTENVVEEEGAGAEAVDTDMECRARQSEMDQVVKQSEVRNGVEQDEVEPVDEGPDSPKRRRVSSRSKRSR